MFKADGFGGFSAAFIPLKRLLVVPKIRLQERPQNLSFLCCLTDMFKADGFEGFSAAFIPLKRILVVPKAGLQR